MRSVQRKPLRTRPLRAEQKAPLEASVGPNYSVLWFESLRDRTPLGLARCASAKIRLTTPEAYAVHSDIIEWDRQFSEAGFRIARSAPASRP